MAYTITNKKTGVVRTITDEEHETAILLPGFLHRFKVEPILQPSKIVGKKEAKPEPDQLPDESTYKAE